MSQRSIIVILLTCAIGFFTPASAIVVYRDTGELTGLASRIVLGDVTEVTSFWDAGLIKSRITVGVSDYLVGSGSGIEILEMSGGTVGDTTLYVSVLPMFQPGDHVLLFLGESEIRLVESFQGAYLTDGADIMRTAPACGRAIPESRQPLAEFLAEVQAALPPGTTLPEITPYQGAFQLPIGAPRYGLCGADWTNQANPMGENYVINANCVDGSAGSAASQITQLQNGTAAWNTAGADFVFTYGGTSTLSDVVWDNTNLVYFDTTPPDGGGYVAATYYWTSGGHMTECDLVFNDADYTWWNGSGSCSNMMDIWDIAAHEFGHFLCLADLYGGGDTAKTMYGYVSNCETNKRTLETDDINGIIAIYGYGSSDTTPPIPNPMTFAVFPAPAGTTSISMTATTATDATSPPVSYFFTFVSGGSGGASSPWLSTTTYTNSGLTANTAYGYNVRARDSAPTPNVTAASGNSVTATYIETPTGLSFGTLTTTTIDLNATGTLTNLSTGSSGVYFDSTTTGGDGGINAWVQVATDTATGLSPNTSYTFQAKARNQNSFETAYVPTNATATLIQTPTGVSFGTVTSNSIVLNAGGTFTNLNVGFSGLYFDSTTTGGDGGINVWVQTTTDTATGLLPDTSYIFQVKARNQNSVETAYTSMAAKATLANVPAAPTLANPTSSTMTLDVNANGNPTWTVFAIQCTATSPNDAAWLNKYVNAAGASSASAVWQTDGTWANIAVNGLQPATTYTFAVKARNQENVETAFGPGMNLATLPLPTGACCYHDGTCAVTQQAACTGTWTIGGTCAPNLCLQPDGSCCYPDGTCAVTKQAACTGTWTIDGTCVPNLCLQPTGACCYAAAPCALVTQTICTNGGGAYQGNSTPCTPHPCCLVLGDMNGDTYVNGADIQGFVDAMLAGFAPCADLAAPYDVLDMNDVSAFVSLLLGS